MRDDDGMNPPHPSRDAPPARTTTTVTTPVVTSIVTSIVAVVPVFNEADRAIEVLDGIERQGIAAILVVNDGSTDGSAALIDAWVAKRPAARAIHLPENEGKSAALRAAWDILRMDFDAGRLSADTLVVGIDGDGQHDLRYIGALLTRIETLGVDAVIARRDLSYHGPYKRAGNVLMTAIGSACAGRRLYDIECGYRVVRLGALLHAQEYYRGSRYSEAAELMVVLTRLGYRVDNSALVRVPSGRTRTRLSDAAKHVFAMCAAAYRVACWRDVPVPRRSLLSAVVAAVVMLLFAGFLGAMLMRAVYLGNDSAQSYAHVWFIEQALYSGNGDAGGGVPLRMPNLEAGRAFTFPYGLLPWLPAAVVRPLLGDWAVTASMALGALLLMVGIWRWRPRTRSPLLTALLLLNPQFLGGIAQFQLPAFWALALACFSAAEFTRSRPARGTAFAVAALYAHPLVGGAALCATALANAEAERRVPRRQITGLAVALVLAAPAVWTFTHTPLAAELGYAALAWPAILTVKRVSIIGWAWAADRFMPAVVRMWQPLLVVAVLVIAHDFSDAPPVGLWEASQPRFPDLIAAGRIDPRATYRVLTTTNHEDGMVQLMQAGAVLGQEFFDESIQRRSFGTPEAYRCFLRQKRVDHVIVSNEYAALGWTDEVRLLDRLVQDGQAVLAFHGPAGTLEYALVTGAPVDCGPGGR